jgi:lysophosphatidylcholine acyltransferase/lyso-PAF acetyltransferase
MGVDGGASASASSVNGIEAMHTDARFLPFTRRDQYGHMGLKPQPLHERVKLAIMSVTLMPLKLAISLSIVLICFLTCKFSELLPKSVRSDFCAATGKVYARGLVFCLGLNVRWIKVKQTGRTKAEPRAAGLISNHCSWADILIHLAHYWCSFAAREGTEKLLMIGQIRCGGGSGCAWAHGVQMHRLAWQSASPTLTPLLPPWRWCSRLFAPVCLSGAFT